MLFSKKYMGLVFFLVLSMLIISSFGVVAKDSFTYWSMWEKGEPQQMILEGAIEDFEKDYNVDIDVKWVGRDVVTAIKPRMLAGENIDIVDQCGEEIYGGLVANDVISKMNDVLELQVPHENQKVKDVLSKESYGAYIREDGSLYIIPYNFISSGFWYDKNLFNELQIKVPETWEEFLVMAEKLRDAGLEPVAFGLQTDVYRGYIPYNTANRILGKGALNAAAADSTGELFKDPKWVEVGNVLYTFSKKGKHLFMDAYESSVYPAPQMDWIMGIAGTFYCGSWIPVETQTAADPEFEYGAFQFPSFAEGEGDSTSVECYPIGFSILKDAENEELAKKFVAYFLQKKYAESWVKDTKNMTPRKDVSAPEELSDIKEALDNANSTHRLNDGVQADYPEWYANVFLPTCSDILTGKISGEGFAKQLSDETVEFWGKKNN